MKGLTEVNSYICCIYPLFENPDWSRNLSTGSSNKILSLIMIETAVGTQWKTSLSGLDNQKP